MNGIDAAAARAAGLPAEQVIRADDPRQIIDALAGRGYRAVQAEGGPTSMGRLARAGLLDELCLTTTHRTVGGPSPRLLGGVDDATEGRGIRWELRSLIIGEHAHIARYRRTRVARK